MSKLLLIGIDGMDPRLVRHWLGRLPNLARLSRRGTLQPIESVFPADSLPAWTTIYTGKPPGEHGLFESIDYLAAHDQGAVQPSRFAGQTFWDEAGRRGSRVCVVNALMAYPVWPVNGAMLSGPVFVTGDAQSFPRAVIDQHPRAELGGVVDYPYRWELGRFAQRAATAARQQARLALSLMASDDWDLFFLCLLTLDRVQHFFWRFHDPSDPAHPGPNPYERVIFDHYRLMDRIVGELADAAGPGAAVMVLSDHGHGQRPSRLFHLNEWLRQQGHLAARGRERQGLTSAKVIEKAKAWAFSTAVRLKAEDALYAAARLIPKQRRASLKESSFAVDRGASKAFAGKLGGASGSGGIVLGPERVLGVAEGEFLGELADALLGVREPRSDAAVVEWARPREEVVQGPYAAAVPHLLFRLRPGWGISRSVHGALFSLSPTHRRVSGGHTSQGVLVADRDFAETAISRLDQVYDVVLDVLGRG